MWGIVIQVFDKKIFLEMDDGSNKIIINEDNLDIKENNYIEIVNNKIVNIKEYNEELYFKIKSIEQKIKKNNN